MRKASDNMSSEDEQVRDEAFESASIGYKLVKKASLDAVKATQDFVKDFNDFDKRKAHLLEYDLELGLGGGLEMFMVGTEDEPSILESATQTIEQMSRNFSMTEAMREMFVESMRSMYIAHFMRIMIEEVNRVKQGR